MKEPVHTKLLRTFSGKYVNVFEPTAEMICIEDIAHSLAHQCRFAGHLKTFYSVAQHSVLCAERVSHRNKLQALMHDASEAYLLDIPRPIKPGITNYYEIEDGMMNLIADKFGFRYPMDQEVKEADETMLQLEWDLLMIGVPRPQEKIVCLTPDIAKNQFLNMFMKLTLQREWVDTTRYEFP